MRQNFSPEMARAPVNCCVVASSLEKSPALTRPSATPMAPVRVAALMRCVASEGLGVVQAVGQDEAAFGVGVYDLDGLAGHGGDDVAGLEGLAIGHVLARADNADDADVGLELGDGAHSADHRG